MVDPDRLFRFETISVGTFCVFLAGCVLILCAPLFGDLTLYLKARVGYYTDMGPIYYFVSAFGFQLLGGILCLLSGINALLSIHRRHKEH